MTDIRHLLTQRILVLDGAMGTMIQRHTLTEQDFRGERFLHHSHDVRGNNDLLNLTRPDIIQGIHEAYFEAVLRQAGFLPTVHSVRRPYSIVTVIVAEVGSN